MQIPTLIIIGGFAGAGKSTISTMLSKDYRLPIFGSDAVNDSIRSKLNLNFHDASPAAYETMWNLVIRQLKNGLTVVVDVHMCYDRTWQQVDEIYKQMPSVKIIPIILQCTIETHKQRIDLRGRTQKDHLNLGGDKLEDVIFKYEYIEELQRKDIIRVDANGTLGQVYSLVKAVLEDNGILPSSV